jgi:hypothetical protein
LLGYDDYVDVATLATIRKKFLGGSSVLSKMFLAASNGEPAPSPTTAIYWRTHPEEFSALCATHADVTVLLAFGVPVDLISQKIHAKHLVRLPFWQSNGACKTHPEVDVLSAVPGEYVLLRCKWCLLKIKVVS